MDICASCGVVSPRPGQLCQACRGEARRAGPGARGTLYFVAARCSFQCRGCGRAAPLDAVDVSDLVRCGYCGLTQSFDAEVWPEGIAFAQAVGDLAGGEGLHPHRRWAIGTLNPYADVGHSTTVTQLNIGGTAHVGGLEIQRSLRVRAAPGHPLCTACGEPLRVEGVSSGQIQTRCTGCLATARFDVSDDVLDTCAGLRGVLCEATRADLRAARTVMQGARVVGVTCPTCGSSLSPEAGQRTVECTYCHAVSRVPGGDAISPREREPEPIWFAFSGPSALREALESGEDTPADIQRAPEEPVPILRTFAPAALLSGGVTLATGLLLFILIRARAIPMELFGP